MKRKITLGEYFWIFVIVSMIGTYYEEIMHIILHFIREHEFDYSRRAGVFYGPLSPVYGVSAVVLLYILGRKESGKLALFLKCSILGGVSEYAISFIQELFTGTKSWDYSDKFLNIGGRTTVPFMIFWGLSGFILIEWIYPLLKKMITKMNETFYKALTVTVAILVFLDVTVSWSALIRMELRHRKVEPFTVVGKLYDTYFDDNFIEKKYPNMKEK